MVNMHIWSDDDDDDDYDDDDDEDDDDVVALGLPGEGPHNYDHKQQCLHQPKQRHDLIEDMPTDVQAHFKKFREEIEKKKRRETERRELRYASTDKPAPQKHLFAGQIQRHCEVRKTSWTCMVVQ